MCSDYCLPLGRLTCIFYLMAALKQYWVQCGPFFLGINDWGDRVVLFAAISAGLLLIPRRTTLVFWWEYGPSVFLNWLIACGDALGALILNVLPISHSAAYTIFSLYYACTKNVCMFGQILTNVKVNVIVSPQIREYLLSERHLAWI